MLELGGSILNIVHKPPQIDAKRPQTLPKPPIYVTVAKSGQTRFEYQVCDTHSGSKLTESVYYLCTKLQMCNSCVDLPST
jgi:hypothetical protein